MNSGTNKRHEGSTEAFPRLSRVRDTDALLIVFSGHGFHEQGNFYLVPEDNGKGPNRVLSEGLLRSSISGGELAEWLRNNESASINLIIDSCDAAAALGSGKASPMPTSDKGLGELAINKRMRILAGSESDQRSRLYPAVGTTLLVHSLLKWGLDKHAADFRPKDGKIFLTELFTYATVAVPDLAARMEQGSPIDEPYVPDPNRPATSTNRSAMAQKPRLFDYTPSLLDFDLLGPR